MDIEQSEQLCKKFFSPYGSEIKEYRSKQLYLTAEHPQNIHSIKEFEKQLKRIDDNIKSLNEYIGIMQAIKIEYVKRYNYLLTAPTKEKILLQRYKKYKGNVFYYIYFYSIDLNTGEAVQKNYIEFKGTEKKKAIAKFEELKKEHKNAVFEIDIDKKIWER